MRMFHRWFWARRPALVSLLANSRVSGVALRGGGLAVWGGFALCACGAPQLPAGCDEVPIEVRIDASQHLNESVDGAALPTQLQLVQLASAEAARDVSFDAFWADDASGEAEDVLAREHLTVFPRTRTYRFLERDADTAFVMAAARFRAPEGDRWRELLVLPRGEGACGARTDDRKSLLLFQLEHYNIQAPIRGEETP